MIETKVVEKGLDGCANNEKLRSMWMQGVIDRTADQRQRAGDDFSTTAWIVGAQVVRMPKLKWVPPLLFHVYRLLMKAI